MVRIHSPRPAFSSICVSLRGAPPRNGRNDGGPHSVNLFRTRMSLLQSKLCSCFGQKFGFALLIFLRCFLLRSLADMGIELRHLPTLEDRMISTHSGKWFESRSAAFPGGTTWSASETLLFSVPFIGLGKEMTFFVTGTMRL